jgi:hypothetical protein
MTVKRLLTLFGLLTVLLSSVAFATPTMAQGVPANDAAEICRSLDEEGVLDEFGVTRGECVNLFKGPASANANNFIAAVCGVDFIQENLGVSNKGQCIKVVKELFANQG